VAIRGENLVKTYDLGGQIIRALDDVSMEVKDGDLFAITGTSGSGKTTLMNILGCLDRPDSGNYFIQNDDVARLGNDRLAEIRNRHIGFVFQSFNLLPRMSALENVELPLLYAGRRDAKEKAEKALHTVGLGERMHHEPNQLSGGQRQRVAVARAIVGEPAMILADEPTGNLDSRTGVEILELFKNLNAAGRTIVIVTHDRELAKNCRSEINMRDGKIVERRGTT
jgi:putative ABC transport system ATP-binding protein